MVARPTVGRRRVAAVVIVAALVAVLFGGMWAGRGANDSDPGGGLVPSGAAVPVPSDAAGSGAGSSTGLPTGGPSPAVPVPSAAPAGVRWQLFQGVAVPFSAVDGPADVRGDVAGGFAHTPVGALLASQQIAVRKLLAPDWRAVVAASIAPGPGRDAWVAARGAVGELAPTAPGQLGQVAGFRFVDYSPRRAVIQTVSRFGSGRLQVTVSTVRWSGRDWQLVLQPDGGESPTAQAVGSLAGFVPWGGV